MFEQLFDKLDDGELWALSKFIKRVTWADIRSNAENDFEAETMRDAILKLGAVLAEEGYYS